LGKRANKKTKKQKKKKKKKRRTQKMEKRYTYVYNVFSLQMPKHEFWQFMEMDTLVKRPLNEFSN
jgi:hypothetical protein